MRSVVDRSRAPPRSAQTSTSAGHIACRQPTRRTAARRADPAAVDARAASVHTAGATGSRPERCRNDGHYVIGLPGVGKTHLSVALGVKAVEAGYSVLLLSLEALMGRLIRARHENRLDRSLQQLAYPKLLILDELGYLPLSREEASLFFRLLVRRYERGSLIVTSNKSFTDWGEVFNDHVLATAILDRLLHHATTINIKGESYRLRDKRKAGILGKRPKPTDEEEVPDPA